MIGKNVSHYKILSKLGEGGMGVVYKAEDTRLKRTVALKFLSSQALGTKEEKARFVHEAQAAAALDHSNICTIHEINEADGKVFMTMAYVDGPSLKEELESGPMDMNRAVDIAIQVAEGLGEAHEKGIIHRDIKSANIMLTSKGQAKITDFGLAKIAGRTKLTRTGSTVGTLAYMSPEQVQGEEIDQRGDIWSLGVVLYELLTAQTPFKGDHEAAVIYSIMNQDAALPSSRTPGVPPELDSIVAKMLQKNPDDRYSSTEELLSDLRKVQAGAAVQVSLPKNRKAKRLKQGLSAVVVAVVLTAVVAALWPQIKGRFSATQAEAKILAVVDFDNIGGEDASYLAGGLAEGISLKLTKLAGIRVVNSDDVRRLRKRDLPAREVASQLGAQYALEGSVLRSGDRIRVMPQLVDVSTGDVVWSEPFDKQFTDVFEFLDEVSLRIAGALKVELTAAEEAALQEHETDSAEAYDHYLKGRELYYRSTFRDNEQAEKEFQTALRIDPEYPLAMAGLADTYVQRYKERYDFDEHWLDEADRLIENALKSKKDLAEAFESQAEALYEKEDYLGALDAAEKARRIRPEWDEPYLRLGEIYQERGEGSRALEMYNKALELRPSVDAFCGKGNVFETRGDLDSAEVAYRHAAVLNLEHDRPLFELGYLYYNDLDDLDKAESMYRKAIEVRPDRGRSYEHLVYIIGRSRGRLQEAEDLLRNFAEKYPYNYDAYATLYGFLAWERADFPAALHVIEEATARNPGRVWPLMLLAEAYAGGLAAENGHEKAIETLKTALELRPGSGPVLHWTGYNYRILGELDKAIHYYHLALKVSPGNSTILYHMANAQLELAQFDSAAVYASEGIRQAPGLRFNYYSLARALSHSGRVDEIVSIYKENADKYGQDDPMFYYRLAGEQRLAGDYHAAIDSYQRVIDSRREDKPGSGRLWWSLRGLGMTQWLAGDTNEALATFHKVIDSDDRAARVIDEEISLLVYLGRFEEIEPRLNSLKESGVIETWMRQALRYYISMRRFDKALETISQGLQSGEAAYESGLKVQSATLHRLNGDIKGAMDILDEIEPSLRSYDHSSYDLERAYIEAIRENIDRAIEFANKAQERSLGDFGRNYYLEPCARLLFARGRVEDAVGLLKGADAFEGDVPVFYRRAQMVASQQLPGADDELEQAFLIASRGSRAVLGGFYTADGLYGWSPGCARVYAALAAARLGDARRARSEIEYAVRLEPERADIAYGAACAYALTGDIRKALDWLQTAVDRGHQELWWARVDPDLDPLRKDPRFKEIMKSWDRQLAALRD